MRTYRELNAYVNVHVWNWSKKERLWLFFRSITWACLWGYQGMWRIYMFKHSGPLNSFYGGSVTLRCWLVLLFIFLKMMVLHKLCYFCFDVYSRLFYLRQMDDSKREREKRSKWVPWGEGMFFLPSFNYIFLCFPVLLLSCSHWGLFHNTCESSAYLFPLPY